MRGNSRNITFSVFLVYFKGILINLSQLYRILLLTLLCCKIAIGGKDALFGEEFFRLIFGWCKESDILHDCTKVAPGWRLAGGDKETKNLDWKCA